jgi:hypothetical protein
MRLIGITGQPPDWKTGERNHIKPDDSVIERLVRQQLVGDLCRPVEAK